MKYGNIFVKARRTFILSWRAFKRRRETLGGLLVVQTAVRHRRLVHAARGSPWDMTSGSSELLLDPLQELRKKKLTELANTRKKADQKSRREQAWFYVTLFFAMATVTTGTSLLFLVPLYVDPAISTLIADFIPEPVTCTTTRRDDYSGLFNCSWSSCREGCTSDFYRCTHIYVQYAENTSSETDDEYDASKHHEAVLLVNIKGCGYPPNVRCSNFTAKYGVLGAKFPCYYSRQNKTVAMNRYDRAEQVRTIVHFFVVPFVICIVSSVTLCVMHCDCRNAVPSSTDKHHSTEEPNRFVPIPSHFWATFMLSKVSCYLST